MTRCRVGGTPWTGAQRRRLYWAQVCCLGCGRTMPAYRFAGHD